GFYPQTHIGDEPTSLKHTVDEDRDSSNRDPQSQSDAQVPGDHQQGMDEGTESGPAHSDNDLKKEGTRKVYNSTNETQDPDLLTSEPK
ncbi:hypothetical protein FRC01_009597, partial [Tulasnella sp. 417]